jgi:two-component system, NarL family, nitrate/nitrite response regulator NarL
MVRVLIVDDQRLFADTIRITLEGAGMDVLDIATDGAQALALVARDEPDIVLMDIGLPDRSGLAVGRDIIDDHPNVKVIALTALDEPKAIDEALRVGFHGYVTKDTPVSRFHQSIESAMNGQVVTPHIRRRPEPNGGSLLARQLTPRERQVLELIVTGKSSRAIARQLGISPNTFRTHVQAVLTKLQVHTRLEAATFAVQHGLVSLPQLGRSHADG